MKCVMKCGRSATHVRVGTVAYTLCGHCTKQVLFILRDAAERSNQCWIQRKAANHEPTSTTCETGCRRDLTCGSASTADDEDRLAPDHRRRWTVTRACAGGGAMSNHDWEVPGTGEPSATDTFDVRIARIRGVIYGSMNGGYNGSFQTDDVAELLARYETLLGNPPVERVETLSALLASAEKNLNQLFDLHMADDDEHGMDCQKEHPRPMLMLNPDGCGACRIFKSLGFTDRHV